MSMSTIRAVVVAMTGLRTILRRTRRVVVVVVMVMVVIWVVVTIPPPIVVVVPRVVAHCPVPIVPRVARVAPPRVVEGVYAVVPAIGPGRGVDTEGDVCCTPRAEHRRYVLGLHPHLVTRYHDVVVCRVVGCGVGECRACSHVVVARRHTIGWRLKAIQTARIGTIVVVSNNVRVVGLGIQRGIVLGLGALGLSLSLTSLPLCATCLCLGTLSLCLGTKSLGDLNAIVGVV